MRHVGSGRLPLAVAFVAVVLVAGLTAGPASAAAPRPLASRGPTSAKLATIVSTGPHAVTYRLPSGRLLTLGKGAAHFDDEPGYVDFLSSGGFTTSAGIDYDLFVEASRYVGVGDSATDVAVTLERETDSGSVEADQYHTYVFSLPASALQFSEAGPTAVLSTSASLAEWGDITLSFTSRRGPISTCHGGAEFWRGASAGSMTFTPQADNGIFGTIQRTTFRTARLFFDTGCGGPPPAQPSSVTRRCPTPGGDAYAESDSLTRYFTLEDASFDGIYEEYATQQIARDPALIIHEIEALSATSGLTLGPQRTATLQAFPGSFMSGSASFAPEGRGFHNGPHGCGAGHQYVRRFSFGAVTSTPGNAFTADYDTGAVAWPPVEGADTYAVLNETIVIP